MTKSTSKLFQSEEPKEMQEDAMNLPKDSETSLMSTKSPEDDIQNIDLSATQKKRFRINGDPNKILELNTSDLGIASRLTTAYDRLVEHMDKVGKILEGMPDEEYSDEDIIGGNHKEILKQLDAIDAEMKKEIDYIFDAPVSAICADGGSMYDPFNGMFRYEHIIDALTKLYETNINSEFSAMRRRVNAKTSKYTKKYHN